MKIEIVTHCWRYSRVLTYQLSSLVLNRPKDCEVVFTVYFSPDDWATLRVLNFRWTHRGLQHLRTRPLSPAKLLNRAIGRNLAAKQTTADLVWFTDCDYVFGPGCLDALAAMDLPTEKKLFYPRTTQINVDHATGDAYAARAHKLAVLDIDPADFKPEHPGKAIGGIQIVPGNVAREYGYCPDEKRYQRPIDGKKFRFSSDITYREILNVGGGTPIELPNLYRIRQTNSGKVDSLTLESRLASDSQLHCKSHPEAAS